MLDFPYWPKISFFFSESKYMIVMINYDLKSGCKCSGKKNNGKLNMWKKTKKSLQLKPLFFYGACV